MLNKKTLHFIFTTVWSHALSDLNVHQKPSDHAEVSVDFIYDRNKHIIT